MKEAMNQTPDAGRQTADDGPDLAQRGTSV
jgi:hypothetical protein